MVWVWEAYDALSTERLYEGGAIPHSAAKLYARDMGLAHDVFGLLWHVIHQMDLVERRWRAEEMKRQTEG